MFKKVLILAIAVVAASTAGAQGYQYTLNWGEPNTHTYQVSLEVAPQSDTATFFQLAVWRPGRYFQQDYAAAVWGFQAKDGKGKSLTWEKVSGSLWKVKHPKLEQINIAYSYYANNADAGSSLLAENQAYFNPVNLFMYVPGRLDEPVTLTTPDLPASWKIATAMQQEGNPVQTFKTASWHDFADSPTVLSPEMKTLSFEELGTRFYIHLQGDYRGDSTVDEALIKGISAICREQGALFGGFPFTEYHHIYRLLPYDMRHAVEHANSASYALPARITQSTATITSMFGITSHEFFHAWNVKRIRPAALWPYDYSQPQYTRLHWFTEGVTDYYSQLIMVRAGLITTEDFLKNISDDVASAENDPAAHVVSPEEASFDSWLMTSSYLPAGRKISYYTLGARAGLILDLTLREKSDGKISLDQLFKYLYQEYYLQNKGVPENGIQLAAETLTGDSWEKFFGQYLSGTESPDYEQLLGPFGVKVLTTPDEKPGAAGMGISQYKMYSSGIQVAKLDGRGDAFFSGMDEGDFILEINGKNAASVDLEEFGNALKPGAKVTFKINRQGVARTIQLKYTGITRPTKYIFTENDRSNNREKELLEGWIVTLQGT